MAIEDIVNVGQGVIFCNCCLVILVLDEVGGWRDVWRLDVGSGLVPVESGDWFHDVVSGVGVGSPDHICLVTFGFLSCVRTRDVL